MAASRAAHLFFSYHLPSPLQPWHKCEGMSKGVDVLGMLQPFAPAKCFDANQQTKPGFVGEYVFLWLNQHVSQSHVIAREVCFSGFCIPEFATQEATNNWRPVATHWQMQRYHLSIQFPHHNFQKKGGSMICQHLMPQEQYPFQRHGFYSSVRSHSWCLVEAHSRPGMSNTEALCRAASEVTWWSHLFCSPNFASQVGGILLCSVIWLLSLWQLVLAKDGTDWLRSKPLLAATTLSVCLCLGIGSVLEPRIPVIWNNFTHQSSDA